MQLSLFEPKPENPEYYLGLFERPPYATCIAMAQTGKSCIGQCPSCWDIDGYHVPWIPVRIFEKPKFEGISLVYQLKPSDNVLQRIVVTLNRGIGRGGR